MILVFPSFLLVRNLGYVLCWFCSIDLLGFYCLSFGWDSFAFVTLIYAWWSAFSVWCMIELFSGLFMWGFWIMYKVPCCNLSWVGLTWSEDIVIFLPVWHRLKMFPRLVPMLLILFHVFWPWFDLVCGFLNWFPFFRRKRCCGETKKSFVV